MFISQIRELEWRNGNNFIVYLLILHVEMRMESMKPIKFEIRNENPILIGKVGVEFPFDELTLLPSPNL